MECQAYRDNLTAYLDHELSSGERTLVEQHLSQCAGCASEFDSLSRSYRIVNQALEEIDVRPEMWQTIEAAIRPQISPEPTAPRRGVFAAWLRIPKHALAAGSIALVLLFVSVFVYQSRQRPDSSIEVLRPQFRLMIEKMDAEEQKPHNYLLSPADDEAKSNPFALQHVRFERNPFRDGPLTEHSSPGSAPAGASRGPKVENPEMRDSK
ncbi:MAG TPA: zf-HC2 domain-containing protein [Acidobacteriota bacterium]|jgi:hypothetical protein